MDFKRRSLLGILVLFVTSTIILCVRLVVEQPSSATQTYTFGSATLSFETNRTRVWQIGDCVNLRWNTANIQAIYLNRMPTVGQREMLRHVLCRARIERGRARLRAVALGLCGRRLSGARRTAAPEQHQR